MEERLIEAFRRLFKEHKAELKEIINDANKPVIRRHFRPSRNQTNPSLNTLGMVIANPFAGQDVSPNQTRQDILCKIEDVLRVGDAVSVLKELASVLDDRGLGKLLRLILRDAQEKGRIENLLESEEWESHSMAIAHYYIKIERLDEVKRGNVGRFNINLCASENNKVTIDFENKIHKVIYLWFLLHPCQFMTKKDIWNPAHSCHFGNENLARLSWLMYPEGFSINSFANKYIGTGASWQDFNKEFPHIKTRIMAVVEQAWKKLGGQGRLEWYTIQEKYEGTNLQKEESETESTYLLNLDSKQIVFSNCDIYDPQKCRMDEGTYKKV